MEHLPPEIVAHIITWLPPCAAYSLSLSCHYTREIITPHVTAVEALCNFRKMITNMGDKHANIISLVYDILTHTYVAVISLHIMSAEGAEERAKQYASNTLWITGVRTDDLPCKCTIVYDPLSSQSRVDIVYSANTEPLRAYMRPTFAACLRDVRDNAASVVRSFDNIFGLM